MARTRNEALAAWLDRSRMTQRELAELAGISEAMVSRILSGQNTPSLPVALRLAELTGVPIKQFASRKVA